MGKRYLIDTNVVVDFSENKMHRAAQMFVARMIDNKPCFSVINKIELLGFSIVKNEIVELLNISTVHELSEEIIDRTIKIRKTNHIKLPDAIIAATALVHDLILVTRNTSDFKNIEGLKLSNPWNR